MSDNENLRRSQRKKINNVVEVEDGIRERTIGRIGNLSRDGLMLICSERLVDDALYQLRFSLPGDADSTPLEIGVHEQWTEEATVPGQYWSGLRIIDIAPDAEVRLQRWLAG